jgi:signal transduction histidine kinase
LPAFPRYAALLFPGLIAAASHAFADAPPYTPYQPDAHTLHLWHLDEAAPPFVDAGTQPLPLSGLHNGARPGQTSLPGLGNAISLHSDAGGTRGLADFRGGILTAASSLDFGPADNVDPSFRYFGPDGAFTYEMIVKFDVLPHDAGTIALGLLSMDGDDSDRIFNCRIEPDGFLAFIPLADCGATGGAIATIPTSGPHAIDTESWFHIAFAYDGHGGSANNLRLYWTRLSPGLTEANRIGSGTLSNNLNGQTGDFAIGNEAHGSPQNAEAEPFPGLIDQVRISGVARHPTDYFFVPQEMRQTPERLDASTRPPHRQSRPSLYLASVLVNGKPTRLPTGPGDPLELGPGLHRLDFDFGFQPDNIEGAVKLRSQLEGADERWLDADVGMSLSCHALDEEDRVIARYRFQSIGRSPGWQSSLEDSEMTRRVEPIFIPHGTKTIRLTLGSGSSATTGLLAIRNLSLAPPEGSTGSILKMENFSKPTAGSLSPAEIPSGWRREGDDPAIARMVHHPRGAALGLVDGDQKKHGQWVALQKLPQPSPGGQTLVLSWEEVYNVISCGLYRATHLNVPPGRYTFRAIGLAGEPQPHGCSISLPLSIRPPVWQKAGFWPVITLLSAALVAAFVAAVMIPIYRRRAERRVERLRFLNALENDRTRIASDMHDDLGTRITVINMTAALARRDLAHAPEKADRHLAKLTQSARELVVAMDDLVWAVDPSHDTLDELGSHLARLAEEMFRDTSIRCRIDIPAHLPDLPLGAEFRHHVALAAKEAMHNALRHAGPCEVFLSLRVAGNELFITVRDTGVGFDPASPGRGNGLGNLAHRFARVHGHCRIRSAPGRGTTVELTCRLPDRPPAKTQPILK